MRLLYLIPALAWASTVTGQREPQYVQYEPSGGEQQQQYAEYDAGQYWDQSGSASAPGYVVAYQRPVGYSPVEQVAAHRPVQYAGAEQVTAQSQYGEAVITQAPIEYFQHLPAASQQYSSYADAEDPRDKRESLEDHPDAYLRPPSADADTPAWQDGNNWDLGYDASDILSPPMPLSMGIPYDTIKYSSEEAQVPEVSAASSDRHESRAPHAKYPRSRPDERPFRRQKRPYKGRVPHEEYEDFPHAPRPYTKRPSRRPPPPPSAVNDYDYEDVPPPPRSHGKRSPTRHVAQPHYYDYDETPHSGRNQAVASFVKTDKHGHYKWGVRHNY